MSKMWGWLATYIFKAYIVIFVGVTLTAIAEILRPKMKKAQYLLILGIIISGIGGVLAAIDEEQFERKVQGNITGGDSYCYVQSHFDTYGLVNFSLKHVGEYPLYDLNIVIRDISKRSELVKALGIHNKDFTSEQWAKLQKQRDLIGEFLNVQKKTEIYSQNWPTLPPASITMPILRVKLPINRREQVYLIKIYARNGTITQPIKFLMLNGEWEMSMRVQKYDNLKKEFTELTNRLHPDVPLQETYAGE